MIPLAGSRSHEYLARVRRPTEDRTGRVPRVHELLHDGGKFEHRRGRKTGNGLADTLGFRVHGMPDSQHAARTSVLPLRSLRDSLQTIRLRAPAMKVFVPLVLERTPARPLAKPHDGRNQILNGEMRTLDGRIEARAQRCVHGAPVAWTQRERVKCISGVPVAKLASELRPKIGAERKGADGEVRQRV